CSRSVQLFRFQSYYPGLVCVRVQAQLDVHSRQQGKDVCLQEDDHELEERECDREDHRAASHQRPAVQLPEEEVRGAEKHDEDDVTGQHVGHKTNGQGYRTEDEGREGFDRYNNEVDEGRQARNDQRGLHVLTEPVTLHTRVDKHHICHKRQYQREADTSAWGDVQERDEG